MNDQIVAGAIETNDIDTIVDVLEQLSFQTDGYVKTTALHKACKLEKEVMVDIILQTGTVDINYQDFHGNTAAHYGIYNPQIFESLLHHPEINLFVKNKNGKMCFDDKYLSKNCEIMLKQRVWNAAKDAIICGEIQTFQQMLPIVKRFNLLNEFNSTMESHNTLLHVATSNQNISLVRMLLNDPEIDTNVYDTNGYAPLHVAIEVGTKELVVAFLEHPKVDLHIRTFKEDLTPVGFAKLHYKKEICKLIEAKLNPTISKKQPRLLSISLLIEEAKQFVKSNNETAVTLGTNYQIDENSSLWYNCPALQRFEAAIKNRNERYVFAWHGTHGHSISSICHEGFDPKRRQGQAKGKGEYFGASATSSKSYTKNSNKMIVVCILDVKLRSHSNNSILVVENPLNWSASYVLPVLVVTYGTAVQNIPHPFLKREEEMLFISSNYNTLQQNELKMDSIQTRNDYIMLLSHLLIWKADCSIYGGLVRDWIVKEEEPKDIDCALPISSKCNKLTAIAKVKQVVADFCSQFHIRMTEGAKSKLAYTLKLQGNWNGDVIDIDLVDLSETRISAPYVDSDVGNLMVNKHGFTKKVDKIGVDLLTAIQHCKDEQFVFYYNTKHPKHT